MEALSFCSSIETIKEIDNYFLPNPKFKLKEKRFIIPLIFPVESSW